MKRSHRKFLFCPAAIAARFFGVPAVWQNPDIWEKRSWREAGGNEQHRLRGLTELLCFLPAEDASKQLPLFRTTVQLHHAGGQIMIQSVHSQLGRHRWRML